MNEAGGSRLRKWLVVAGIAAIGIVPPAAWRLSLGPSLTTFEVRSILSAPGGNAVLVDVRPRRYGGPGPAEVVSWPIDEIRKAASADLPAALRGRRLLMICDRGFLSGEATRRLRGLGIDAWNVEGGLAAWQGGEAPPGCEPRPGPAGGFFPFRESPAFEQWIAVLSGFAIKPAYMLLSLLLAFVLWRRREPDLAALRWSMVAFFAGELACYLNFFIYKDSSRFTEYLHSYGMAVGFGFGVYALFEALDRRVFGFSDAAEKCALLGLCRPCAKHGEAPCGLRRLFLWGIFFAMLLSLIPLTAGPRPVSYETRIFGTPYAYEHPLVYQLNEIRLCPVLSLGLAAAAWLALFFGRGGDVAWPKALLSGALGFLGFGLLRLMLLGFYRENLVWFTFWEEATELMGVLGAAVALWIFRKGLWARPA